MVDLRSLTYEGKRYGGRRIGHDGCMQVSCADSNSSNGFQGRGAHGRDVARLSANGRYSRYGMSRSGTFRWLRDRIACVLLARPWRVLLVFAFAQDARPRAVPIYTATTPALSAHTFAAHNNHHLRTPFTAMSGTSTPDRETQLLDIGQQCTAPSCMLIDFLPFKCHHCAHAFCGDHFLPEAHKCDSFDVSKHNRVAPSCPLCNTPVAIPLGQDPNIRMEAHINTECSLMSGKSRKSSHPTCARAKCGKVLYAPIQCAVSVQLFWERNDVLTAVSEMQAAVLPATSLPDFPYLHAERFR